MGGRGGGGGGTGRGGGGGRRMNASQRWLWHKTVAVVTDQSTDVSAIKWPQASQRPTNAPHFVRAAKSAWLGEKCRGTRRPKTCRSVPLHGGGSRSFTTPLSCLAAENLFTLYFGFVLSALCQPVHCPCSKRNSLFSFLLSPFFDCRLAYFIFSQLSSPPPPPPPPPFFFSSPL